MAYHALLDSSTNALLALTDVAPAIVFVHESVPDTWYVAGVNHPNYLRARLWRNPFPIASLPAECLPEWTWRADSRTFVKTPERALTENLRSRATLASAQASAIQRIMQNLNVARSTTDSGVVFQELVYHEKAIEARAFKEAGYDESRLMEFPFLRQYSEIAKVSARQAADDILLKAKLDKDILLKTEAMRLTYFARVRSAKKPDEIGAILEDFAREFHHNARV
jgi:hypothetical protein